MMAREEEAGHLEREFFRLLQTDLYAQRLADMLSQDSNRLPVSLDDLRAVDSRLPGMLMAHPVQLMKTMEEVLHGAVSDTKKGVRVRCRVALEGNFGDHYVTPRGLRANLANTLVKVQGIVSRVSLVRPKLQTSVHYCEATGRQHVKSYGNSDLTGESLSVPVRDSDGNPLWMEFGLSQYQDTQTLLLQEFPEKIPAGQLPRSIDVLLEDDLVDAVKPGDRVDVVGVFRAVATGTTGFSASFRSVLVACSAVPLESESEALRLTGAEVKEIKKIAEMPDALARLAESLAPSIYGHNEVKQALILQALGGREKTLGSGTHLRGDINILLVGDPSTAKSQLLRIMLQTVPRASCTSGRGSSGVGLTAAVVVDKDTGERHLAAGATVLADKGLICIDEFDKIEEMDRVAMHEVMEQQTVTIAKAGIHCSLNARCSVLAAANPIYGTYAPDLPPAKNIALPDSLLSRFDLLFVILDHKSNELDRKIAERVIKNHSTGTSTTDQYEGMTEVIEEQLQVKESRTWYRAEGRDMISRDLLRKFLHFAKSRPAPDLSVEASSYLAGLWTRLRTAEKESGQKAVMPITVRSLETLIRLATACAKVKLSAVVDLSHCQQAEGLYRIALSQEEDHNTSLAVGQAVDLVARLQLKRRREEGSESISRLMTSSKQASPEAKRAVFMTLTQVVEETEVPNVNINVLLARLQAQHPGQWQAKTEMMTALRALQGEDKVLLREDQQTATLVN
jgi:DNA replication licensing factor MCM3